MQKNRPTTDNIFSGGMHEDNDFQLQPKNTYRKSVNGRILFNSNGGFSWVTDKGNKLSFTLKEYDGTELVGYQIIGSAEFDDKVVLYSTDDTNSEIGYVTIDAYGDGVYQQVYNDKYDPDGKLLGFEKANSIEAHAVRETVDIENTYWTDNNKIPYVINIQRGKDFSYTPTLGVYPFYYSAHSFQLLCDWDMGRIKYVQRIEGSLKTGVYQYTYRQGTLDGYRTSWYPITRHIIMNSDAFSAVNHNDYQMNPSNIVTDYGFELEITGIDQRFPILEVAYLYSITETQTVEAGIFYTDTTKDTKPSLNVTVSHTSHAATPIAIEELNRRSFPIRKVKTFEEKDNRLFLANIEEVGVLEPDLTSAVITPLIRTMNSDELPTDRNSQPFTNETPLTTTVTIQNYTGSSTTYEINGEYASYKGTQWEHLFTSYWRGETYRVGVLLFDRKGTPNYTFFLDDYTFPEQHDASGDFTLTTNTAGDYTINMLGMTIDGVKIPVDILYDEFGNINLSGFSIVRAKRVNNTMFQGVILDTVFENNDEEENDIKRYRYTRPLPFTGNYFSGFITPVTGAYANNSKELIGTRARSSSGGGSDFANRAGTFLMYSPDIIFGYVAPPVWQENDRVKLAGLALAIGQEQNQEGYNLIEDYGTRICHYYSKNYDTRLDGWSSAYNLGDYSFIEKDKIYLTQLDDVYQIENYDNLKSDLIYTQYDAVDFDNSGADCETCRVDKFSWGMPASLLLILKDFSDLSAGSDDNRNRVLIANYQRNIDSYYNATGDNALENTLYISTGHFQPINAKVIADTEDADGNLVFNGIEVWGGDCYPNFWDYTRLLPQYRNCELVDCNCVDSIDCYQDYSVSMIVPIESNINFSLRYGRQFAKDGVEPEISACTDSVYYKTGIQEKQREDFNINSVLQHEENVQFFPAKPSTVVNRKQNPNTIIYSQVKYYGEYVDSYRIYLANNQMDLTGVFGGITKLFSQYSYIYFLQNEAFGRLYINQPATIQSEEQGTILVGSAGVLTGALYISQNVGCQHQFSVTTGHNQTYWTDVNLGKIYRFTQNGLQPISDQKGLHNKIFEACKYFKGLDDPSGSRGGISGVYDYKNNEYIVTFRTVVKTSPVPPESVYNFTLVYNENLEVFTTFIDILPRFYFSHKGLYFSAASTNTEDVYVHLLGDVGRYYGELKNSELEIISEPDISIHKIYNGCMMNINTEGSQILSSCLLTTENNSENINFLTDTRQRYRNNMFWFPIRGVTQVDRVRGKYLSMDFTLTNDGTKTGVITSIENKFNIAYSL